MRKLISITAISLMILGGSFLWYYRGTSPANPQDQSTHIFVVQKGDGLNVIADNLKNEGLISDVLIFKLFVKQKGLAPKIQAGTFRLSPSMDAATIATQLTTGTLDIWITIPEGKRADEIADLLKNDLPTYDETWRDVLNQNEGYLFPDTYLLPREANIDQIVSIMKNNFDKKYAEVQNPSSMPQSDIVILASLIEREARHDEDRALVSSVMHNRLDIGMKLDIDATVQYAVGYDPNEGTWWKKGLTFADTDIDSPYNTYNNNGLPPGPICNPGLEALQAAANPATTDYSYYISDKQGINHYAKTLAEHNANIKKYGL